MEITLEVGIWTSSEQEHTHSFEMALKCTIVQLYIVFVLERVQELQLIALIGSGSDKNSIDGRSAAKYVVGIP